MMLFLASFLALFFEILVIRYLSTEIRAFAYLKNLPLIASFLGLGLGMILGRVPKGLKRAFPIFAAELFVLIAYAEQLGLTHMPFPNVDYYAWGRYANFGPPVWQLARFLCAAFAVLALVVIFFVVVGGLVGEQLALQPPLRGYGINLAGSLTGIAAFTLLSSLSLPPLAWILAGLLAMIPFFIRDRLALGVFAGIVCVSALPHPDTHWSPYYRIDLAEAPRPSDWSHPAGYFLSVNHDYHQKPVDLSPAFVARYPLFEPNHSAFAQYELPYLLVRNPGVVLIVGAGTGNDVASALRHGATHVDAVEIDPMIIRLGRQYHPERPYDSPRVTVYVDDARAFFKKARKQYDLIVFGYLDSHTMLTSFSSVRLDNYVYTLESFRGAKRLLRPGGSVVIAFGAPADWVRQRLFATLSRAFDIPARAYFSSYDGAGVVVVEGGARDAQLPASFAGDFPDITRQLESGSQTSTLTTDRWPFMLLVSRKIPRSILWVFLLFLGGSVFLLQRTVGLPNLGSRESLHLFFLGAGFLLLETKAVTELALLFGSTWVVNSVVIGAFLTMALLANAFIMWRPVSRRRAYIGLFVFLAVSALFPYATLDALPTPAKVAAAGIIAALPVFFSGLVFSRSFRDVSKPAPALGVNLLGAVIGGALENTVMVAGTPILGVLAIVFYSLSAIAGSPMSTTRA